MVDVPFITNIKPRRGRRPVSPIYKEGTFIYPRDTFDVIYRKIPKQVGWLVERSFEPAEVESELSGAPPAARLLPAYYYTASQSARALQRHSAPAKRSQRNERNQRNERSQQSHPKVEPHPPSTAIAVVGFAAAENNIPLASSLPERTWSAHTSPRPSPPTRAWSAAPRLALPPLEEAQRARLGT